MSDGTPISKTRRKQAVHELQALGEELVELNENQLATVDLPESLLDAVMHARTITKHEARRRQMQYIGKLMRRVDPAPIRTALDAFQAPSRSQAALHKRIESWRERLLAEPAASRELLTEYPQADIRQLGTLIDGVAREREAGKPPRSYRELYQALRALLARAEG
jgi:ribosome-associated protein